MHLFIDHAALTAQTTTGSTPDMYFGPDPTTPTTKFNITTQHTLSAAAKAFACQKGLMIIQRNDSDTSNLVNAIIRPSVPLKVHGLKVRYYVYKGLDINSFFQYNSSTSTYFIRPDGLAGNSEFLENFWDIQAAVQAAEPGYTTPTPLNLGYGDNTLAITDKDSLHEDRPVDDLFFNKATAKAFPVSEGMWIGDFQSSAKIGFDIVMEDETLVPFTLKHMRANTWVVETGSLTGYDLKVKKEHILSFIDPAAFWGLHYKDKVTGVNTTAYTGTTKGATSNRTTPGSLYEQIIEKYANKNRVYIDIRSEKGRSYNYYNSYKVSGTDPKNVRLNGAAAGAAIEYGTNGWPLMIVTTKTSANSRKNKLRLRLHRTANPTPILYLPNKYLSYPTDSNARSVHYYAADQLEESGVSDWTKEFTLYYPHNAKTAKENVATYIRLYYFLRDPVSSGTDHPWNARYYDSAFCSLDLGDLGDTSVENSSVEAPHPIFVQEALQTDGTGNFAFLAKNGAYWDSSRVLFYAQALVPKLSTSEKAYRPTFTKRLELNNYKYSSFRDRFQVICREYKRTEGSSTVTFKILGINDYRVANKNQEKEDLMLLGLTAAEITTLKAVTGLSKEHPRHIFLSPDGSNPKFDTSARHHRYHRYNVMLQGMNASGTITRVSTSIDVFSRDNQFFHSEAFSAGEDLSDGFGTLSNADSNRIEYHIYHDGKIKINDNIDLALLRKYVVQDEHNTQAETVASGDTSEAQQIHYIWHPASTATSTAPVLVASFNAVMANKMKKNGTLNPIPSTYVSSISFTSGTYRFSLANPAGNIVTKKTSGATSGLHYINQGKKVFLVHFVTALTTTDTSRNRVFMSGDATPANNNNTLGLKFVYGGSRRRYANPAFAAAVIGGLIRDGSDLTSSGMAFGDASSAPSANHVNGLALDSSYFKTPAASWQDDVDLITEFDRFGIRVFRIGFNLATLDTNLSNEPYSANIRQDTSNNLTSTTSLHDTHLHSEFIDINE